MKRFLLVKITKGKPIEFIRKVRGEDQVETLGKMEKDHQLWSVETFVDGIKQINAYNEKISSKVLTQKSLVQSQNKPTIKIWDWSKVPLKKKKKIIEHHNKKEYFKIFVMHNEMKLTGDNYCCDSYIRFVDHNIQIAKENGILQLEEDSGK